MISGLEEVAIIHSAVGLLNVPILGELSIKLVSVTALAVMKEGSTHGENARCIVKGNIERHVLPGSCIA